MGKSLRRNRTVGDCSAFSTDLLFWAMACMRYPFSTVV